MSDLNKKKLAIAFESEKLTYSKFDVDLYNTGITQILSVAASRGHNLYHFCMSDLYWHNEEAYARASVLKLPKAWQGEPITAHQYLKEVSHLPLKLSDLDLCFARGDDIRDEQTPNLDVLQTIDTRGALFESLGATLSTADKYELIRRLPDIPSPATYTASSMTEARRAINNISSDHGYFVLKDRYGYGGGQVHRLRFEDPELDRSVKMYLSKYDQIIIQEYCPEIKNGDLVITFFDGKLIAPLLRKPAYSEWKTNLSFGSNQIVHVLTHEQEHTARKVTNAFPEIRFASVDMLTTGKVLEINSFPGGVGLYENYGISIGAIIMDKLEAELFGESLPPTEISAPTVEQGIAPWSDIYSLYKDYDSDIEVLDVFCEELHNMPIEDLIDFTPRSHDYILSIPHSGVLIPAHFANRFDLSSKCIKEIDLLSDVLYEGLDGLQIVCRLAPFFIDMNRPKKSDDTKDLPYHLKNTATEYYTVDDELLLKQPYSIKEREYVESFFDLYHAIIEYLAQNMIKERGYALIIDAHSMSSVGWGRVFDKGEERSNFVVGTLDDESADSEIIQSFCDGIKSAAGRYNLNLTHAKNEPYSGGFITRTHHDPKNMIHVIQLEVTMGTYMYEADESDSTKRYALKQPRLKIVQDIVKHAIESASITAKRIHNHLT